MFEHVLGAHYSPLPNTASYKKFDIDEFFEKLSAFQGLQKRKKEPEDVKEKEKNLALKVERAFKNMSRDFQGGDNEDCEDSELALITKVMKKF